jgi:hypothetical protein
MSTTRPKSGAVDEIANAIGRRRLGRRGTACTRPSKISSHRERPRYPRADNAGTRLLTLDHEELIGPRARPPRPRHFGRRAAARWRANNRRLEGGAGPSQKSRGRPGANEYPILEIMKAWVLGNPEELTLVDVDGPLPRLQARGGRAVLVPRIEHLICAPKRYAALRSANPFRGDRLRSLA